MKKKCFYLGLSFLFVILLCSFCLLKNYAFYEEEKCYTNKALHIKESGEEYAYVVDYDNLKYSKEVKNALQDEKLQEKNIEVTYNGNNISLENPIFEKEEYFCKFDELNKRQVEELKKREGVFKDKLKFVYLNDNNEVVGKEIFMEVKDFAKAFNIAFNSKFKIYDFLYVSKKSEEPPIYLPEITNIDKFQKRKSFDSSKNSNIITTVLSKDFLSLEISQGTNFLLKNGFEASINGSYSKPFLLESNDRILMYVPVERLLNILKYDSVNVNDEKVRVINNDDKKDMVWQEVYIKTIKMELEENGGQNRISFMPDDILRFGLYDFTGDDIPELLFYEPIGAFSKEERDWICTGKTSENFNEFAPFPGGSSEGNPFNVYKYNQETCSFDFKIGNCTGVLDKSILVKIGKDSFELRTWDEETENFTGIKPFDEEEKNNAELAVLYSYPDLERMNLTIEDIVYNYKNYFNFEFKSENEEYNMYGQSMKYIKDYLE